MQRPWGRTRSGVLEEQRGDLFGRSRESKGERAEWRVAGGGGSCRALWAGGTLAFTLNEMGDRVGCGDRGGSSPDCLWLL